MMKIDKNNYESYFLDYLEGNLDDHLVNDFIEFLQNYPNLKQELSLFKDISLEPSTEVYKGKKSLLKEELDMDGVFDETAIAYLENDLSPDEKTKLETYLATHPDKRKDLKLYELSILQPDHTIVFKDKKSLKRKSPLRKIMLWSGRVAAVLACVTITFLLVNSPDPATKGALEVAELKEQPQKNQNAEINMEPDLPLDKKKKVEEKNKPETPKIKKEDKKKPPVRKSVRESTDGRNSREDLSEVRTPIEVPDKLNSLSATLPHTEDHMALMTIILRDPETEQEEVFLADVIKERTGMNRFRLRNITKAGLNLVTSLSNEKFQVETDKNGNVMEYKYDSRLLAFSIPSKNAKPD